MGVCHPCVTQTHIPCSNLANTQPLTSQRERERAQSRARAHAQRQRHAIGILPAGPRREGIGRKKANKKMLRDRDTHIQEEFHTHPVSYQCTHVPLTTGIVDGAMACSKMQDIPYFSDSELWTRGSSKHCKDDTEKK